MKLRRQKGINYSIAGRMKSYGHKATFETVLRGVSPVAPEKLLREKKKKASDFFRSDLIFLRL